MELYFAKINQSKNIQDNDIYYRYSSCTKEQFSFTAVYWLKGWSAYSSTWNVSSGTEVSP